MDTTHSTLKTMWETRPPRIPKDQGGKAIVAGVCEGIGARYQIDPIIARISFVALSLVFGGGIFIYLLMWINMPRFGMPSSPLKAIATPKEKLTHQERKERDTGWWLIIGLLVFFPSLSFGSDHVFTSAFFTLALATAGLYLLHRNHPVAPAGLLTVAPAFSADTQPSSPADMSHLRAPEGYPHPGTGRTTPPSWDPLATAPELWHLPDVHDASTATTPAPKKNQVAPWLLAGGAGLIALVVVTGVAAAKFEIPDGGAVEFNVTDDLRATYDTGIGTTTIDFSGMKPLEAETETTIDHGIGTVTIIPPEETRVELRCGEGIGSDNCPATLNDDAEGATLKLNVNIGIGDVDIAETVSSADASA